MACMSPVGLANFKQPRVVGMWVGFGVVSLADPVLSVVPDKEELGQYSCGVGCLCNVPQDLIVLTGGLCTT